MRYTDSLGFTNNPKNQMFSMITEGEAYQIIYEKAKTEKWWMLFFPYSGLSEVYAEIENKFYTPKSGRNRGFELLPMLNMNCMMVMCYKDWMSKEQFSKLMMKYFGNPFDIPEGKDIAFCTYKGESEFGQKIRMNFFMSIHDFYLKQEKGE